LTVFFSTALSYTASSGPKHISQTCVAWSSYSAPHSRQRNPTTLGTGLSLESANLQPPFERGTGFEHRSVWARTLVPAKSRLDRDLAIAAQVAVACPDAHVRGQPRIPAHLDALARWPSELLAAGRPLRQEDLRAGAFGEVDLHAGLVPKQWMCAPERRVRLGSDVAIEVIDADDLRDVDRPFQLPRQNSPPAPRHAGSNHVPMQPPRLAVVGECFGLIHVRHHLVPAPRPALDEPFRARLVDSDALVQEFLALEAEGRDPPTPLRPHLEIPTRRAQSHRRGDRSRPVNRRVRSGHRQRRPSEPDAGRGRPDPAPGSEPGTLTHPHPIARIHHRDGEPVGEPGDHRALHVAA